MLKLEGGGKALGLLDERFIVAVLLAALFSVKARVALPPLVTVPGVIVKPVRVTEAGAVVKLKMAPVLLPALLVAMAW
jgi:hypothetical protein